MQLPRIDAAIIEEKKIVDYLLNPKHPDGAAKAEFYQALGFSVEAWRDLALALRQVAVNSPITRTVESNHGRKYIIEGDLKSPLGKTAHVRMVWIEEEGFQAPRLVTAYPCRKI